MAARKDQEPCRSVTGPEAHAFELRQSDTVVLIGSAQIPAGDVQNTRLDITYRIEGIDPAAAAADALASAFPKRIPGEPLRLLPPGK